MKANALFNWTMGLAGIALVSACKDCKDEPTPPVRFTLVSGSGDLSGKLTEFRALLGDPLNLTPDQTTGRREVNWDGVPATLTNPNVFPGDFFNSTDPAVAAGRKRGLVSTTPGTDLRVSNIDFTDVVASEGNQFNAFSPPRTFAPFGSTITENTFRVPGTNIEATVKGFGVIFSDVDNANSTTVEFFEGNKSLGTFKAPVRTDDAGFSFVGVLFPDNKVSKVVVKSGNAAVNSGLADSWQNDLVVMDDFFYDEPKVN
ncbi:MAG: hypothetical protein H7Z75_16600 [Ferruginibacter sp.]|nr:hypothetical protein [Cytophagales bacterium]